MIGICFSHTCKCAPCDACVRDAHLGRQVVVLVEQQGQRCLQHAQAKAHKHLQTRLLRAVQTLALMLLSAEHATVKDNPVSLLAQAGDKRAVGQQPKCHNALAWEPLQLMHAVGQLHSFRGPCVAWLAKSMWHGNSTLTATTEGMPGSTSVVMICFMLAFRFWGCGGCQCGDLQARCASAPQL